MQKDLNNKAPIKKRQNTAAYNNSNITNMLEQNCHSTITTSNKIA